MQYKDIHKLFALNTDDNPANLPEGDVTHAFNLRMGSSDQQHGEGPAETLQGEIELLINPDANTQYYGQSVGGNFIYQGFDSVVIGSQIWMKKNYDADYPGSKVYDNDEDNRSIYGGLYTHNQIMSEDFCPSGWHVPTEAEWNALLAYLGDTDVSPQYRILTDGTTTIRKGIRDDYFVVDKALTPEGFAGPEGFAWERIVGIKLGFTGVGTGVGSTVPAGGRLKEYGFSHWLPPNVGADDYSGFKALPGGKLDLLFDLLGESCLLWLADDSETNAPAALNGSIITAAGFTANWLASVGAAGYKLDVSTSIIFASFVAGYNDKDIGNVLTSAVVGLGDGVQYYYRVRAYNDVGESENSNTENVLTLEVPALTELVDLDDNVYTTVQIGNQLWIIENLKTTKYADGSAIPNLTLDADWIADVDGAQCVYNNDNANKAVYGLLYNWYAVNNPKGLVAFKIGGVLQAGWRTPTEVDFDILTAYLLGSTVAGGKLKEIGLTHWDAPNMGATNEYGFLALGAGYRNYPLVEFRYMLINLIFSVSSSSSIAFLLSKDNGSFFKLTANPNLIKVGCSVRCVKDLAPVSGSLEFTPDGEVKGPGTYRIVVRNHQLCWDRCLTSTGFDGTEDFDWENIKAIP
jgi:uncharacterized protein (TIGR02145 family)